MPARQVLVAIVAGAAAGAFFLSRGAGGFGGMILACMAPLPLFLGGLTEGIGVAGMAAAIGAAAVGLSAGPEQAVEFALMMALPPVLLVALALKTAQGDCGAILVGTLAGLGLAAGVIAAALAADEPGGLEGRAARALSAFVAAARQTAPPGTVQGLESIPVPAMARILPGFSVALWLVLVAVNGVLAQGAAARFAVSRWQPPAMEAVAAPWWVALVFAAGVAMASTGAGHIAFAGITAALITVLPLAVGGLGVVHTAALRMPSPMLFLAVSYGLTVVFGWPILVLVALGIGEQCFGLRRRIARRVRGSGD